jgi:hypothetical protein
MRREEWKNTGKANGASNVTRRDNKFYLEELSL